MTHNALSNIDVTAHTTSLVELRASHNVIRRLPRNIGGGPHLPRRLALAAAPPGLGGRSGGVGGGGGGGGGRGGVGGGGKGESSSSGAGAGATRATAAPLRGLRVLHIAHNDLETLPSDLGATLAGAGRSWSVEVHGNPFGPALRRRLEAPPEAGGGVAGLLAHLAEISADLDMLPMPLEEEEVEQDLGGGGMAAAAAAAPFKGSSGALAVVAAAKQRSRQLQIGSSAAAGGSPAGSAMAHSEARNPRQSSVPALANAPEALRSSEAHRSAGGALGLTHAPRASQAGPYTSPRLLSLVSSVLSLKPHPTRPTKSA